MQNPKSLILSLFLLVSLAAGSLAWRSPAPDNLTGTQWKGLVFVPHPEQAIISFKKDTLFMTINSQIVETEYCHIKGDTLILKKISGGSPCTDETGYYKYVVKADLFTMTPLQDDCTARTTVFSPEGYQRVKN